ncbi:hypothetical protein Tco_0071765 [Tanacetum coccineum]
MYFGSHLEADLESIYVGDNEQYLGTVHWRGKEVYVCLFEGAGESELDPKLAPTCMINRDLELLVIIAFASSLQYHRESCYLVNMLSLWIRCMVAEEIRYIRNWSNAFSCEELARIHRISFAGYNSPTAVLLDVDIGRISIVTVNTKEYHSDVLARSQG